MKVTKEDLTIFGNSFTEILVTERTEGRTEGQEEGQEMTIMQIRRKMGFSAEQIANITEFTAEFIQSVIDKHEQKQT